MHKDLEAAARMQRSLLPVPCTIRGLRCDSLFLPASAVAGDVFNFFPLNASSTGFYLLDVSGHGIPAAMLSVTLSKMLNSRPSQGSPLVQTASDGITYEIRPHNEAVAELNRRFQDQGDMYFTMVYGLLDKHSRRLQIVQAGHPVPVLLRRGKPPIAPLIEEYFRDGDRFASRAAFSSATSSVLSLNPRAVLSAPFFGMVFVPLWFPNLLSWYPADIHLCPSLLAILGGLR
jgi:serine phosphatase RsbU (regulator of sigma subunit)